MVKKNFFSESAQVMLPKLPPELLRLVLAHVHKSRDAMALAPVCKATAALLPDIKLKIKTQRIAAATRIQATVRRILVLIWILGAEQARDKGYGTLQDVLMIPYWSAGITGRLRRYLLLHPPNVRFKNILSWRSA